MMILMAAREDQDCLAPILELENSMAALPFQALFRSLGGLAAVGPCSSCHQGCAKDVLPWLRLPSGMFKKHSGMLCPGS